MIQTKLRAERLGVSSPNLFVVSETNLSVIRKYLERNGWAQARVTGSYHVFT